MSGNFAESNAAADSVDGKPRLDFQLHLRDLEAQGLLLRIDR